MTLNAWVADRKRALFEDLLAGHPPREGAYDETVLKEGKAKGKPLMGTARYEPRRVTLEFIYADPATSATVLAVALDPPERIVFLPVPPWVIESIWQGEVDGSFHFESDARTLYEDFEKEIREEGNSKWFGPQPAKRRE